ncbi:basic leucine zipper 34-like [Bidens hawaiensis]|uniref:basic leucine zipper 34-like n=1 Tax=Bidens hawaiensis TaxID=980011 RepID=UPI0040491FD0
MAQLPPKAPTLPQKWPSFAPMPPAQPWMDDFSSAKRSSHRRSASDPIQFVETPFVTDQSRNSTVNESLIPASDNNGFERLDDEQLSSMFSDDFTANLQSPSTPSDQNSDNDDTKLSVKEELPVQLKIETTGEVEDGGGYERATDVVNPPVTFASEGGTIVDPKRVKRILANRQSAQRSRVRKLHYISELERSVTTLQTEVSALSPRVAFFDHQRLILNVDNSSLKQRIAALAQDKIFKDAHQEALKKEIERLRKVYHEQNMSKADSTNGSPAAAAAVNGTDE